MSGQRGSVLAGILSLGLIMTLMAGGYLAMAGNAGRNDDLSLEDMGLRNAAESGLNLGVRWMRTREPAYFDDARVTSAALTFGTDGFAAMDGFLVRVRMLGAPGALSLESTATRGAGRDTCRITQRIASVTTTSTGGFSSDVTLGEWQERLFPAD